MECPCKYNICNGNWVAHYVNVWSFHFVLVLYRFYDYRGLSYTSGSEGCLDSLQTCLTRNIGHFLSTCILLGTLLCFH